jgi:transposase-like protein
MKAAPKVSPIDVRLQVVALALEPGLALARLASLPLDDLQRLVAAGYFRDARARGWSFRAIAKRFDKSLRTVTNLSNLSNEHGVPLESSQRLGWRRQLVHAVAARPEGLTERALFAAVPEASAEALAEELAELIEEGILERAVREDAHGDARGGETRVGEAQGGETRAGEARGRDDARVRVVARHFDLVQDELGPRLESFRHFLRGVAAVAYRRFFVRDDEAEAFARVLSFSSSRAELVALRERSYAVLRDAAFAADAAADADTDDAHQAVAVFAVAEEPTDPAWRPRR